MNKQTHPPRTTRGKAYAKCYWILNATCTIIYCQLTQKLSSNLAVVMVTGLQVFEVRVYLKSHTHVQYTEWQTLHVYSNHSYGTVSNLIAQAVYKPLITVELLYKDTPEMRDISFNRDTMHGPSYIEKCTKLPLK